MRHLPLARATVVAALALAGCADWTGQVRRHTYPPTFKYVGRTELKSAMWRLAADVNALDDVMRSTELAGEARRARMAELLADIDAATDDIAAHDRPTNHPLLTDRLDGFRSTVVAARASVDSGRPNEYLVGSVSGACLVCHAPGGR